MQHAFNTEIPELVARLLQDPRVRNNIDAQSEYGGTALHQVCESSCYVDKNLVPSISRSRSLSRCVVSQFPPIPTPPPRPICKPARGEPLPQVALVPVTGGGNRAKKRRQFRTMLAFLIGMRVGPEGKGMPRDVFRTVLDLLMSAWDPLRRGVAGAEMPLLD